MYGCTDYIMEDTKLWLKRCKASVFHPLILPMIFAEHERKRLFNEVDVMTNSLWSKMMWTEMTVKEKKARNHRDIRESRRSIQQTSVERDCESMHLRRHMASLQNGLESFHTLLVSMRDHLQSISRPGSKQISGSINQEMGEGPAEHIDARLQEMTIEIRSKIGVCERLLESLALTIQMVICIPDRNSYCAKRLAHRFTGMEPPRETRCRVELQHCNIHENGQWPDEADSAFGYDIPAGYLSGSKLFSTAVW